MKLVQFNEHYGQIGFSYCIDGTFSVPKAEADGNPLKGELLHIKWDQLRDQLLNLRITLPEVCFVDTVVLDFGPKTALEYAQVSVDGQVVCRHSCETGKGAKNAQLQLRAGVSAKELILGLRLNFATLQLENIRIFGAVEDTIDLFPTPKQITIERSFMSLPAVNGYSADSDVALEAARLLQQRFIEDYGKPKPILSEKAAIRFFTDPDIARDGYHLSLEDDHLAIRASNLRGFVMGVETLLKLIDDYMIPEVSIRDEPAHAFRGVHLFIPSMENMDYAKRLIKYLVSPMGYNVVILQVSGGMVYERHPKISEAFAHAVQMRSQGWPAFPHHGIAEGKPITKAQLKEYVAYIRSFGIEVIPEIQSLAHVQYLTHAYPEIAEIAQNLSDNVDTHDEDKLPSTFYHHDYCPSNPRTYEILFDVIDEIIEVFEPTEYIHMGHDEVRSIGACPRCKGKSPVELFTGDVMKIYNYLKSKGLKMMLWADMLQPFPKYPTAAAIDLLPRDIVLLDFIWYFHLDKDIEENLLEKGFPVLFGNLYSSHFPRYESRSRKPGIHGGQISAWTATNEYEMQKEGKLYDFLMTAQLLWSSNYREVYRLCYDRMLRKNMPVLRDRLRCTLSPSRERKAEFVQLAKAKKLPNEVAVSGRFRSLIFHHSSLLQNTRAPWSDLDVVGKYIITYADGTTEAVPLTLHGNVGYRYRRQNDPVTHPFYRHTGYIATYYCDSDTAFDETGRPLTTYRYEYVPKENKPIVSVALEEDPAFAPQILWEGLTGVR